MLLKFMILLVIVACVAPFFIKGPDGAPLMTLEDWIPEIPDSASDLLPGGQMQEPATSEQTKVYRWKDADGVWQFSNDPADAASAEEIELDGVINTMEAFTAAPEPAARSASESTPGVATVLPPQAAEALEAVKNLQQTIDDRKEALDQASGITQ